MDILLSQPMPLARILKNQLELSHNCCGDAYVRIKDSNWVKLNDLALHALQLRRAQDQRYTHPYEQMAARYVFLKIENLYLQSDERLKNSCFKRWFVQLCDYCARCFGLPIIRDEIDYHRSIYFTLCPEAAVRDNFSTIHPSPKKDSMKPDWLLYDNGNVYDIMEEVL